MEETKNENQLKGIEEVRDQIRVEEEKRKDNIVSSHARIINTSTERSIDESKVHDSDKQFEEQIGLGEEEVDEEQSPPIIDEVEPQDDEENEIPYYEKDYLKDVINSDPVLKASLTYSALKKKQQEMGLREDEKQFMLSYESEMSAQSADEARQAEVDALTKETEDKKQAILKEYMELKKINPNRVTAVDEDRMSLNGDENLMQILKFLKMLKKAKKKGGKVLVQVFKTRKVVFQYTSEDLLFVEFFSKDEKGNQLMDICRFNEYKYTWDGTPVPVLFAVQGFAEGFDFYSDFRKSLDSETVNNLMLRSYHAGFLKGAEIREPEQKNNFIEQWAPILLVVTLLGVLIMLYFGYMTFDKLKFLNSDSMTNLALLAKAYADSNGAMVIQTASSVAPVVVS